MSPILLPSVPQRVIELARTIRERHNVSVKRPVGAAAGEVLGQEGAAVQAQTLCMRGGKRSALSTAHAPPVAGAGHPCTAAAHALAARLNQGAC